MSQELFLYGKYALPYKRCLNRSQKAFRQNRKMFFFLLKNIKKENLLHKMIHFNHFHLDYLSGEMYFVLFGMYSPKALFLTNSIQGFLSFS